MATEGAKYLSSLHQQIDQHFNFNEVRTLCFNLGIDFENIPGAIRSAFIRNLTISLAKQNRLQELIDLVRQERPRVKWPDVPADFELPAALAQENIEQVANYHVYGDYIVGDITNAQAVAIGAGATAVYQGLTVAEVAVLVAELKRVDQPTVWDGRIPYLGLSAFQESDAQFFFGRESLMDKLYRQQGVASQ